MKPTDRNSGRHSFLLGLGLDGDGHRRLTRGPEFVLVGGSEETHERMQEHALKLTEELERRGKRLSDVRCTEELRDIADQAGL